MRIYDIIDRKKRGAGLTKLEIDFFIRGVSDGGVADYQISALLMAMYINGISDEEAYYLTLAMAESGERFNFLSDNASVDKHSTGGVGDSTTFIVLPIVNALGRKAGKMSGRGLGLTGGTLDKLEAIPGFKSDLSEKKFLKQMSSTGMVIASASKNLCPADKRLYEIRDVTATVDSIPLIAASVMSKKLAAGAKNIVLDVKCGKAAFMKTERDAYRLAKLMVDIGKKEGRNISAIISAMDMPLSNYVGNALEVCGAVEVLRGKENRLKFLSVELAKELLRLSGYRGSEKDLTADVDRVLRDGTAFECFKSMIRAQGGDTSYIDRPEKLFKADYSFDITAQKDGYIADIDALQIAEAVSYIGAGRVKKDDKIDLYAGVELKVSAGEKVRENQIIAKMYYNRQELMSYAKNVADAITVSNERPAEKETVLGMIY